MDVSFGTGWLWADTWSNRCLWNLSMGQLFNCSLFSPKLSLPSKSSLCSSNIGACTFAKQSSITAVSVVKSIFLGGAGLWLQIDSFDACHSSVMFPIPSYRASPTQVKAAETTMRRQLTFWLRSLAFWKWFGFSASQVWMVHLGSHMPWMVHCILVCIRNLGQSLWICDVNVGILMVYRGFRSLLHYLPAMIGASSHTLGTFIFARTHTHIWMLVIQSHGWMNHGSYGRLTSLLVVYVSLDFRLIGLTFFFVTCPVCLRCLEGLILRELSPDGLRNVATTLE